MKAKKIAIVGAVALAVTVLVARNTNIVVMDKSDTDGTAITGLPYYMENHKKGDVILVIENYPHNEVLWEATLRNPNKGLEEDIDKLMNEVWED